MHHGVVQPAVHPLVERVRSGGSQSRFCSSSSKSANRPAHVRSPEEESGQAAPMLPTSCVTDGFLCRVSNRLQVRSRVSWVDVSLDRLIIVFPIRLFGQSIQPPHWGTAGICLRSPMPRSPRSHRRTSSSAITAPLDQQHCWSQPAVHPLVERVRSGGSQSRFCSSSSKSANRPAHVRSPEEESGQAAPMLPTSCVTDGFLCRVSNRLQVRSRVSWVDVSLDRLIIVFPIRLFGQSIQPPHWGTAGICLRSPMPRSPRSHRRTSSSAITALDQQHCWSITECAVASNPT